MGHHICHLPDIITLTNYFERVGVDTFAKKYAKYEAFIGDSEAIKFVEEKIKMWFELKKHKPI